MSTTYHLKHHSISMRQSFAKYLITFLITTISSIADAQQRPDIVQIMGQFVQSSYAASRCIKPDQKTLSNFLFNYKIVSVRAGEELKKRNPAQTHQQIADGLKMRTRAVENAIDSIISENGCDDPRIQDLLKRFEIQANLKL